MDQLSARWLERADGVVPTPNFDRLRRMGVSFTTAITSNPLCCPARATMATGLTSRQHGVLENGYILDPRLPTFMRALQDAGWRTGAFGKLHLRPHGEGVHHDYRQYGFDVVQNTEDPRAGDWLDWILEEHPEHAEAALATIWPSWIPELENYGPEGDDLATRIKKLRETFDYSTPDYPEGHAWQHELPLPGELSQTEWVTRHAGNFINGTQEDQSFFAHVSYVQPHGPSCPPKGYLERVNPDAIPDPLPAEWREDPNAPEYLRCIEGSFSEFREGIREKRQLYFADIAHLDEQVGRLMEALERVGRLEDTFVILTSDHGELLGDHGVRAKGEKHYDACIRVPLYVAGPGLQQDVECEQIAQLEDICPTILDAAGASLPPRPVRRGLGHQIDEVPRLPGRSLLPLCRGDAVQDWRDAAYCESYNNLRSNHYRQWARTIRTARYRYTYYPEHGEQMFDLQADPGEQHNVVADHDYADVRRDLRDRLMDLVILQDYPKTERNLYKFNVH
jgi:choline-sulfatase